MESNKLIVVETQVEYLINLIKEIHTKNKKLLQELQTACSNTLKQVPVKQAVKHIRLLLNN